jgi:3-hydroxyisobutyrate dehydrogenase-like beta-hydroxyacid dehydrogenase
MAQRIGFLGPGLMGRGIIKDLMKKGFPVMVYAHRNGLIQDDIHQAGAVITKSPKELGAANGRVLLCVPSSKEVEASILGAEGMLGSMKAGTVVVDFSTSYPGSTRMLYDRLKKPKVTLLDAPMTGTAVHATPGN